MKNSNQKVKEQIYKDMQAKLLTNYYTRGARLVENEIADTYGVNKLHVKDALQKLLEDGLVEYLPMKGYYALGLNVQDLIEIAKLRMAMETLIIEDFLLHAGDTEMEEAKRLTRRKIIMLENGMRLDAAIESKQTYELMCDFCEYPRAVKFLRQYSFYIDILIKESMNKQEDIDRSINNSKLLLEALEQRNVRLMKKWIRIRCDKIIERLNNPVTADSTPISSAPTNSV